MRSALLIALACLVSQGTWFYGPLDDDGIVERTPTQVRGERTFDTFFHLLPFTHVCALRHFSLCAGRPSCLWTGAALACRCRPWHSFRRHLPRLPLLLRSSLEQRGRAVRLGLQH